EFVEVFPAVDAGVMAVVEAEANGVVAGALDAGDGDVEFAPLQHLLARAVALDLGARRVDAEKFGAEALGCHARKAEFQGVAAFGEGDPLRFHGIGVLARAGGWGQRMKRDRSSSAASPPRCLSTKSPSMTMAVPALARSAAAERSSSSRSLTVCRRRAPMFSVRSFTSQAISAMRRTPSALNATESPSVPSSSRYCSVREALGSVRMRSKSPADRDSSSTRM